MDLSISDRRRAFEFWLRTGQWPLVRRADGTELKFNPWHDPEDGRFTFSGRGRFFPRGSSGGLRAGGSTRFGGGGGATGSWDAQRPKHRPVRSSPVTGIPSAATVGTPPSGSANDQATDLPWRTEVRNGYTFAIDARNRTRSASGDLRLASTMHRSRSAQAQAGGEDRRRSDEGGHYVAARFDGPTDAFNHFAQDRNFNRSGYRKLEDEWTRNKRAGRRVRVRIVPHFDKGSRRPDIINVYFWLNGERRSQRYSNGSEAGHGSK